MEPFTYEAVATALVVVLAGVGVFNVCATAWQNVRKMGEPAREHDEEIMRFFANDKRRIEALEQQAADQEAASRLMLNGVLQLMSHELDGNHVDKLAECRDEIQAYLIRK